MIKIRSRAPIRIDLAGGTLDLWPLYLMLDQAKTINLGINLFADTEIYYSEKSTDPKITFESSDQKIKRDFSWKTFFQSSSDVATPNTLILHSRLLKYFLDHKNCIYSQKTLEHSDLTLKTTAQSPAGAGLGGSSGLCISMIFALFRFFINREPQPLEAIQIAKDIESKILNGPAGLQDYYGAAYGNLQRLNWNIFENERTPYSPEAFQGVCDRTLLFYSGFSRNSGINNWQIYKDFIDRKNGVYEKMSSILEATHLLDKALIEKDWKKAAEAITQEWEIRRTLAKSISTPEIDLAFESAKKLGVNAGKICGAGGGGCFFVFSEETHPIFLSQLKEKILSSSKGIQFLPFEGTLFGAQTECKLESLV